MKKLLLPRCLAVAALALGLVPAASPGQVVTRSRSADEPRSTPLPQGFDPVGLDLNAEPLTVEGLGLQIHLPIGSKVIMDRTVGKPTVTVQEGTQPTRWSMRIQRITGVPGQPQQSPSAHVAGYLRRLDAAGVAYRVLRNEAIVCRGVEGHVCYLEQASPDDQRYVSGWLAMPTGVAPGTGETTMLEFAILTLPEHYAEVLPVLDHAFSTIGIRTAGEVESSRRMILGTGQAVIESFTPGRLRQLVGQNRWYRIYTPAEPGSRGDREIGYSLIEVRQGRRGELNPERDERQYTTAENENGLLVRAQGRIVVDPANESYYDSLGLYWLAWDQSSEAWSVRATQRVGDSTTSESETGLRNTPSAGDPIARITVIRASAESYQRSPAEWSVPEVYLSQALTWLIGDLLPRDGAGPLELAYYTYSGAGEPSVSLRRDRWRATGTGDWVLETRHGADQAPTESVYDSRGNLVRRARPDGTVTEPISPGALKQLWQRQSLRMGRTGP